MTLGQNRVIWFALVAGDLTSLNDTFKTKTGRTVDLKIFVKPADIDKCAYAMDALKRSMRWDEEEYQREYDLDLFMIVAIDDFNMGAMENKGLNIFNSKYILADEKLPQIAIMIMSNELLLMSIFIIGQAIELLVETGFSFALKKV